MAWFGITAFAVGINLCDLNSQSRGVPGVNKCVWPTTGLSVCTVCKPLLLISFRPRATVAHSQISPCLQKRISRRNVTVWKHPHSKLFQRSSKIDFVKLRVCLEHHQRCGALSRTTLIVSCHMKRGRCCYAVEITTVVDGQLVRVTTQRVCGPNN